MSAQPAKLVTVDYSELLNAVASQSLIDAVGRAFGSGDEALGILAVENVPKQEELRTRLLPLAKRLAELSPSELKDLEDESSTYSVGWSRGREVLRNGEPDVKKGSFYANPLVDNLRDVRPDVDEATVKSHPAFFARNIWPNEALPELEDTFKETGCMVVGVGKLVARACDAYCSQQCEDYPRNALEKVVVSSRFCKGRLLHYFAVESGKPGEEQSWCGWHNDHGSLTGLVPAMYFPNNLGKQSAIPNPDPEKAGLYIKSRSGRIVKAALPETALGFQIGETSQVMTGGILRATPHAVRACAVGTTTREAFAVFMEPEFDGVMRLPPSKTLSDVQDASIALPGGVRSLASRFSERGMTFGEFTEATFAAFY